MQKSSKSTARFNVKNVANRLVINLRARSSYKFKKDVSLQNTSRINIASMLKTSSFPRLKTPNATQLTQNISKLRCESKGYLAFSPFHIEEHKQGCSLTREQIMDLYEAKCKDLNLNVSQQNLDKFAKFCYKNCYAKKICLSNCGFGPNAAEVINRILLTNQKITRLDLSLNNFEDEGCMILTQALTKSTSLVSVNLASNEIRSAAAQYLLK